MHYLNAMVSLQLTLLADEATEEAAGSTTRFATTAMKDMTCPVRYDSRHTGNHPSSAPSPVTQEGVRVGGESQSPYVQGGSSGDVNVLDDWPDEWLEDRDAGVTVRDRNGR
jgi:hypothetical protein